MELQSLPNGWDSLDRLYGRCLNKFEAKHTRERGDIGGSAGLALFCRKMVTLCSRRFEGSRARASGLLGY